MTNRRLRAIGTGLLVVGSLVVSQTALAGGVEIRRVDMSDYPTIRLTVVTPAASRVAPTLTESGQAVDGLQAENLGRQQSIVLAVDHSRSMYNRPLADAVAAARTFVELKPQPDEISVLVFASRALSLTGSRRRLPTRTMLSGRSRRIACMERRSMTRSSWPPTSFAATAWQAGR